MWSELWNYWKLGKKTKIHHELDFSWGTSNIQTYNSKNIFLPLILGLFTFNIFYQLTNEPAYWFAIFLFYFTSSSKYKFNK